MQLLVGFKLTILAHFHYVTRHCRNFSTYNQMKINCRSTHLRVYIAQLLKTIPYLLCYQLSYQFSKITIAKNTKKFQLTKLLIQALSTLHSGSRSHQPSKNKEKEIVSICTISTVATLVNYSVNMTLKTKPRISSSVNLQ
jgi:hypothetical protein